MSFDVKGFHKELFACEDLGAIAAAIGAEYFDLTRVILGEAGHTLHLHGDMTVVQHGLFSDGALGDFVPVELNGFVAVRRDFTHNHVNVRDPLGMLISSFFEGFLKDGLSGVQLVHDVIPIQEWLWAIDVMVYAKRKGPSSEGHRRQRPRGCCGCAGSRRPIFWLAFQKMMPQVGL
jgi:hypothetical protein